jgi:hypothetical protein
MATSLANMVSTRADSASRHMLQCRVHKNRLLSWTESKFDNEELIRNKHKYCLAKDELALEATTPMRYGSDQYAKVANAYPLVLSSFHGLGNMANTVYACLMHNGAPFAEYREEIFRAIDTEHFFFEGYENPSGKPIYEKPGAERDFAWVQTKTLPYFRTMGYSVGTAYAHERSGDTMASVMIGGITTVLNGAFPMQTGDRVMWYLTAAESEMFNLQGYRENVLVSDTEINKATEDQEAENVAAAATVPPRPARLIWPEYLNPMAPVFVNGLAQFPHLTWKNIQAFVKKITETSQRQKRNFSAGSNISRQMYMKQKNGLENSGVTNKKDVALIKPFFYKQASDGDFERVFAVCLSPAAPFEMVDIMMSRQSL